MFRYFHKYLKKCRNRVKACFSGKSERGQVAVILILIVAASLIFYAVTLNLGRISQAKVVTTIAANTGTSLLGSYMASFAESIFRTTLGGNETVCGLTGVVGALIAVVVVIIAVILAAPTGGASLYFAIAAVVLVTVALVLQVAVIQPGLTDAFNEIIWHTMDTTDAFTEQGVQTALMSAATDQVTVPDVNDADLDRLSWDDDPEEKISRLAFYYQKRVDAIPLPPALNIQNFLDALRNLVFDDGDGWGLIDDESGRGPNCSPFGLSSECDFCCIPSSLWTEEMGCAPRAPCPNPLDTDCPYVPDPVQAASVRAQCEANSPYGDGTSSNYPWVYDPYRGDPTNTFASFGEQIGRDDEIRSYVKNPGDPNGYETLDAVSVFRLEDTTGYYVDPPFSPATENRSGVFPFFYKITDWGVNLDPAVLVTNDPVNPQCHWCDARGGTTCDVTVQPLEIPQLMLPADAPNSFGVNTPGGADFNTTYCVDGTNPVPGNPPLASDFVRLPDLADPFFTGDPAIGNIEATLDQCAQNAVGNPNIGFWKEGGDRFCSPGGDAWPYYAECSKYDYDPVTQAANACGTTGGANAAANWPDDLMDNFAYGFEAFIAWARGIVNPLSVDEDNADVIAREFRRWYAEAAPWIESGRGAPPQGSLATPATDCDSTSPFACCYLCDPKDGTLQRLLKEIREVRTRLEAWRNTSFAGGDCTQVWCVPPAIGCAVPAAEEATFDSNRDSVCIAGCAGNQACKDACVIVPNGIRGDFEDVVACLKWNANDAVTTTAGTTATGNAAKFQACSTACQAAVTVLDATTALEATELCSELPRSLVPGFDTISSSFVPPDAGAGTTGSCSDAAFITGLDQSALEAQNQVAKFQKRHAFLSARLAEMDKIISALTAAETQLDGFLTCPNGAACRLIKDRINFDDQEHGLPYHVVYGWQDEDRPEDQPGSGKWHLVRVDSRIPERCDGACNVNQTPTGDPGWPRVVSNVEGFLNSRRCYEMEGKDGVVKTRVSRFDETSVLATLLLPNAIEIWRPVFTRFDRPLPSLTGTVNQAIVAACRDSMASDPGDTGPPWPGDMYYGAFILNERADNPECWDLANQLLATGVTSEACAQYYFHGATPRGFDFKFVPCGNF